MTKSLSSNIVKWNYTNFQKQDKLVIDSDSRVDLLAEILTVPKGTAEAVIEAAAAREALPDGEVTGTEESFAALSAKTLSAGSEELEEKRLLFLQEAEELVANARLEAESILETAKQEAEEIKTSAYNVGRDDGYKAGMDAGEKELAVLEQKLREQDEGREEEYNKKLREAEPRFVDIMISLIEKITGVVVENKREVILHLVHNGIKQTGRSDKYRLQCSSEDYPLLEGEKERLGNMLGLSGGIEIIENPDFIKNQCVIEADSTIIDCSLDVQLKNLIENLKLLNIS